MYFSVCLYACVFGEAHFHKLKVTSFFRVSEVKASSSFLAVAQM